jgi:hypothetical protein
MQEQAANLTRAVSVFRIEGGAPAAAAAAPLAAPLAARAALARPAAPAAVRKPAPKQRVKLAAGEPEWEAF